MSTKEIPSKSRDDVLAAREAKRLAKLKAKNKSNFALSETNDNKVVSKVADIKEDNFIAQENTISKTNESKKVQISVPKDTISKSKDEVDKAVLKIELNTAINKNSEKDKEQIKAKRAAKKATKQAKKEGADDNNQEVTLFGNQDKQILSTATGQETVNSKPEKDMTIKDVVETLKDIVSVAKEVQQVTEKISAINLGAKKSDGSQPKPEEAFKSKAELRAERRAKQEAQRAAKQVILQEKAEPAKLKEESTAEPAHKISPDDKTKVKTKTAEKSKAKVQIAHVVDWYQHLCDDQDKDMLKKMTINSNLHPAIVKLGIQLSSRVISGSNAKCIALLDALKKMTSDYALPARTEVARGLEAQLAGSLRHLRAMRRPAAAQDNAVHFYRRLLTHLPHDVDEFDAKKTLRNEIDRYIREQIDMADEAIGITIQNKIRNGDKIMTYGYSSVVERALRAARAGGRRFSVVVAGGGAAGAEALRRLAAAGLPCACVPLAAAAAAMRTVNKVVVGCDSLLASGAALGARGVAMLALLARARNVPLLVAAETHKFADRMQVDAIDYNDLDDPNELIDKDDENSPLKDWESRSKLMLLNLTYDVTPPDLVSAVVTELAILPCTSAPVVLRLKSEYV